VLSHLHIIAFTHRNLEVNKIGLLHIEKEQQQERLSVVKSALGIKELMFLTTCNRVEFTFVTDQLVDAAYVEQLFTALYTDYSEENIRFYSQVAEIHSGIHAVEHALAVASSIDSMVVGEREIITQVRTAFEHCRSIGLTGDMIRILMRQVIQTAKKVYTETTIATKPVSVVSLAYHQMRKYNIPLDARILVIGAGVTNTTLCRFLKKHGFKNFSVFNRSIEKAEQLAAEIKGVPFSLAELKYHRDGFDVILTCTGADFHVITPELYEKLNNGDTHNKIVIDLAIPQDLDPSIPENYRLEYISVDFLQKISNENLKERTQEVQHVEQILHEAVVEFEQIARMRNVEIAMRQVPERIKEIKTIALNEVFKNDLQNLDEEARQVLEKVIGYMEKKYISEPMKLAKEIMLKNG
jgi:glutamyl-tRNA reductase